MDQIDKKNVLNYASIYCSMSIYIYIYIYTDEYIRILYSLDCLLYFFIILMCKDILKIISTSFLFRNNRPSRHFLLATDKNPT